jgi:membrane protease YdiL (CAAX protease family)
MLLGPGTAGLLLTALLDGRVGFRELWSRLSRWRVGVGWYALALFTAPLVMLAVVAALAPFSLVFDPAFADQGPNSVVLTGVAVALGAGILEELGWTGFAIPRLRPRHGIVATGLAVGAAWGAWHFLSNVYWESGTLSGDLPVPLYLAASSVLLLLGQLPAYRVLMAWVYDRTGSLLVAMLMHWSLTASVLILGPAGLTGTAALTHAAVLSAATWIAAVIVILTGERGEARRGGPAAIRRAVPAGTPA